MSPALAPAIWFLLGALTLALAALLLSLRDRRRRRIPIFLSDPFEPRRAFHRVTVRLPADVRLGGDPGPAEGTICDLSAGGATVLLDHAAAQGARLHLRFAPDEGDEEDFLAEVIHCDASHWNRRSFLHCQFVDLSGPQEQRLLRAVADRERAQIKDSP